MADLQYIIDQMADAGLVGLQAGDLVVDERIHRFRPDGHRDNTGWYVLFEFVKDDGESMVAGAFGDWKLGVNQKVKVKGERRLSADERRAYREHQRQSREAAKAAREKAAREAASRAGKLWARLPAQGECSYLARKRIRAHGARFGRHDSLVIPLLDLRGHIHGLQVIRGTPGQRLDKQFWPAGVRTEGRFYRIGEHPITRQDVIVVCEGFATGASIFEASRLPTFVAFNCGNLLPVAQAIRDEYPGNPLIIAGDDDFLTEGNPGRAKAEQVAEKVAGLALTPRFAARGPEDKWTDFNDLHVQEGLLAVKEQLLAAASHPSLQDWRGRLTRSQNGAVKSGVDNVIRVLQNDPAWSGVLRYCEFSYRIMKVADPPVDGCQPGEWRDSDTTRLRHWLSDRYGFVPSDRDALAAVLAVAEDNGYHPVRDYLNGLEWDGRRRVEDWLITYLGAEHCAYTRAVGMKFLIAAVARAMQPPEKADCVMILEGPQGLGKSTALEILGGDWFTDTTFALGDKDAYIQITGCWIVELGELDSFNKAESTRAKNFFSAKTDRYRQPYGTCASSWPRQCVFAGSTNQESYLKDVTGNRRYWPVSVSKLDTKALARDRDQLWAEAVQLWLDGEPWHVLECEMDLFEPQQEARFMQDVWESEIYDWLCDPERSFERYFTSAEIMRGALSMKPPDMKPPEQTRVGLVMKRLGWHKDRRPVDEGGEIHRKWVYVRPDNDVSD